MMLDHDSEDSDDSDCDDSDRDEGDTKDEWEDGGEYDEYDGMMLLVVLDSGGIDSVEELMGAEVG